MSRRNKYGFYCGPSKSSSKKEVNVKINDDGDSDDDDDKNQKISREDNHVYFHAEVNRGNIFDLIKHLREGQEHCFIMQFKYSLPLVPLYLHINSFGGSVFDAMTAIDVIRSSKIPVYTIIEGATGSAGTLISVVGEKRFMCQNAHMLIHQLSSAFWGKMSEMEDDFENNKMLMDKIKRIYQDNASIPKKQLDEILKHDLWWDIDTCLKYKLVDEIWE
tara:strand:- start:54 stop:707 length:654 start_codon:yes stop_codon:yes gene_type:complete